MTEKLKPCPFCGGEPSMVSDAGFLMDAHYVRCMECEQEFVQGTAEMAADLWNRRVEDEIGSAKDLISDWISEGTDDLDGETTVRIEIGRRLIINDKLSALRRAISKAEGSAP